MGYPQLGALYNRSNDLSIYRRFGYLHARILLRKQDEIRILEEKLDLLENKLAKRDPALFARQARRVEKDKDILEHDELLDAIEQRLLEYGTFHSI
jgi:hypothetical protein